jgi:flagellar biosynthesis protein FlhA
MPLPGITIEAELESMLLQAVRTAPDASWPVEPGLARQLVDALHDALPPLHAAARSCALLTTPLCRAPLARLLRSSGLDLPVLSFLEIPDGKPVDIVATIGGAAQAISGSVADQKD